MKALHLAPDYRTCMQDAAHAYLLRHRAEYLVDSDRLFSRAERHLIVGLEVPACLAAKLVHLAWTDMQCTQHSVSTVGVSNTL
ncbi:hypothetical protein [Pseudomonas sp. RA_15y_Pfl2_54]|uniref:hypothetical protein n=1 Tax=Pseudomonas sp. RA_15y_Pfl2_54 TaxID=3088704 RepID=UPI0030D82825